MPVHFVVTGFGEFHGVRRNPTQALVEWLHDKQGARGSSISTLATATDAAYGTAEAASIADEQQDAYNILSCTVLEVSAKAVHKYLLQQAALLQAACSAAGRQPVVLLHLGVDNQRNGINLELQAFNNATFRCPDQAGWQPSGQVIEQGQGLGLSSVRSTALPVQQLAQELHSAGFDCHVSRDAGRFVCNYIYHKSLQLTHTLSRYQQDAAAGGSSGSSSSSSSLAVDSPDKNEDGGLAAAGASSDAGSSDGGSTAAAQQQQQQQADACEGTPCYSLFVHVPSFEAVPEDRQQKFLLALLDSISKRLNRPTVS